MKTFLKLFLGISLTLILFVVTLIGWVYLYPLSAWKVAEKYILPSDLSIRWESLQLNIEKADLFKYDLNLKIDNLRITKVAPKIDAPIDLIQLSVAIHLFEDAWWSVKAVEVRSTSDIYISSRNTEERDSATVNPYQQISSYVQDLKVIQPNLIDRFYIDLQSIVFQPLQGALIKNKIQAQKISEDTISATLTTEQEKLKAQIALQLTPSRINGPQVFSTIDVSLNSDSTYINAVLSPTFENDLLKIDIQAGVSHKLSPQTVKVSTHGTAQLTPSQLKLNLETDINNLPGAIHRLEKIILEATLPLHENQMWSDDPLLFKISNSLNLLSLQPNLRTSLEKACKCKMPQLFATEMNGKAYVKTAVSNQKSLHKLVDAKIKLEPISNPLFYANLALDMSIFRENDTWLFEPALDADIRIDSFKALQKFLDYYHILIPSPLDSLDGKIYVTAKSPLEKTESSMSTKVDVKIDLSSKSQKVSIRSDLVIETLKTLKEVSIYNTTLIDQITLELPPIDPILGIPPISQDKRFVSAPSKKVDPDLKINLHNTIQTTTNGAIRLLSSYLKPYAPLTVDLKTNDSGGLFGKLKIEPLEIKYLRRKVLVEYVDLKLSGTDDPMTINGRLRIDQADYKIFVDIIGATDAPVIQLSSEPALSEADIISVILYGRVSDQLVSAESETAGGVSAAIADRAIGLFGLWAFASTPIQSFSYNSTTKVYTATIQLADGLTAGIGTNWEQSTNFEVRKRLSRRWVLSASWINGENQDRSERLMLQWEKRF